MCRVFFFIITEQDAPIIIFLTHDDHEIDETVR